MVWIQVYLSNLMPISCCTTPSFWMNSRKPPADTPCFSWSNVVYFLGAKGSSSLMRLLSQVGNFSKVSVNQAMGSIPLSLAVPNKLCMLAARFPARSEPVKSQFFFGSMWNSVTHYKSHRARIFAVNNFAHVDRFVGWHIEIGEIQRDECCATRCGELIHIPRNATVQYD